MLNKSPAMKKKQLMFARKSAAGVMTMQPTVNRMAANKIVAQAAVRRAKQNQMGGELMMGKGRKAVPDASQLDADLDAYAAVKD